MTEYNTFYTCNLFCINYLELIQVITNSGSYGYLTICIVRERSSALVCVYILYSYEENGDVQET